MAKLKAKKLCRAFPLPFVKFTFKLVNVLRKQIRIWWSADANNRRKENFYGRKQELQASEDGEHHRLLFRRKSSFKQVCVSFENCVVSIATSSAVSYCDVCSRQIEPDWTADVEKVNPLAPTSGNLSVGEHHRIAFLFLSNKNQTGSDKYPNCVVTTTIHHSLQR